MYRVLGRLDAQVKIRGFRIELERLRRCWSPASSQSRRDGSNCLEEVPDDKHLVTLKPGADTDKQ